MRHLSSVVAFSMVLTGCVVDDSDNQSDATQEPTYTVSFETLSLSRGVASVKVHVASNDGSVLPGDASVLIEPEMDMGSMKHGTPVSPAEGALDENGDFTAHIYYLMDTMGEMGWTVDVTYNGETTTFPVEVTDVAKVTLKNAADTLASGMSSGARPYNLFVPHLGLHGGTDAHVEIYVAAKEDGYHYPGAAAGVTLNAGTGSEFTINSVAISICPENAAVDCLDDGNWTELTADENTAGLYGVEAVIEGYSTTGAFNVRLQVNDNTYTTTGNAYDAEVSPGADGLFDFSDEMETMHGM